MMYFGVIISVDTAPGISVNETRPPGYKRSNKTGKPNIITMSEGTTMAEFEEYYDGGPMTLDWWRSTKYVGLLDKSHFIELLQWMSADPEEYINTRGALGMPAPGIPFLPWLVPAIAFDSDQAEDNMINVYVTPYPSKGQTIEPLREGGLTERDWDRLVEAISKLEIY